MEGNEIAVQAETAIALSPTETIAKAQTIANALSPIIDRQKLFTVIGKNKHVWVEGWTTMLAMLNIFPSIEFVRSLGRPDELAYEARVILRTAEGRVIGSAEHMCSNREAGKSGWAEYAVKSMAQTRAVGKAARLSFSWIMSLAGYATTPAEEMDAVPAATSESPKPTGIMAGGLTVQAMASDIKDWIGQMCKLDQPSMDAMLKEFTKWKIKDKQTKEFTGAEGFLTFDRLPNIAVDWLKRIHTNVSNRYNLFASK